MSSAASSSGQAAFVPTSVVANDYNNYPDFNHDCDQAATHYTGGWCKNCQRLGMPFGGQLPYPTSGQNLVVMVGPAGSVLEGVSVMQPLDVETVALLCLARLHGNLEIPQLDVAEQLDGAHFDELLEAAKRILRLQEQLEHDATYRQTVPDFTEIIEAALHRPTLSPDQLKIILLKEMLASAPEIRSNPRQRRRSSPLIDDEHDHIDQDENRDPQSDVNGSDDDEDEDDDLNPDGGASKSKPDPETNELWRMFQANPNYDLFMPLTSHVPTAANTLWRFVEGHNPARVVLGKPDTSKFFVHRELVSDPSKKDIRHYIDWEGMDWNDHAQIDKLNKWRCQLEYRTQGKKVEPAKPWTLREKEEFKKAVEARVRNSEKMDFEEIRKVLHRVFDGVVQKKGEPLALPTKLENGKIVETRTKKGVLKEDRTGFPSNRGPKALLNKSHTFYDIHILVSKKKSETVQKSKKGKGAVVVAEDEEEEVEEEAEEEEEELPSKKRKFDGKHPGPKDPNPGPKRGPPPPPAAGGNAGMSNTSANFGSLLRPPSVRTR